jgi:hypothetical protein
VPRGRGERRAGDYPSETDKRHGNQIQTKHKLATCLVSTRFVGRFEPVCSAVARSPETDPCRQIARVMVPGKFKCPHRSPQVVLPPARNPRRIGTRGAPRVAGNRSRPVPRRTSPSTDMRLDCRMKSAVKIGK